MLLRYLAHDVGIVAELMRVQRIAGFDLAADAPESLVDLYLDTEAFDLLDHGFALRLRQHDGAFYGRLRPLDAPLDAREASYRQTVSGTLPLPLTVESLAAGALRSALRALAGTTLLDLHARVRTERSLRRVLDGEQVVAFVALDDVCYEWAQERNAVREVKVRVVEPGDAAPIDAMLRAYGLTPCDPDRFSTVLHRLTEAATAPLLLLPAERAKLKLLADSASAVHARRARALLAVASRQALAAVAGDVGMDPDRIRHWVERFRAERLGLFDPGASSQPDATSYQRVEVDLDVTAALLHRDGRGDGDGRGDIEGRADIGWADDRVAQLAAEGPGGAGRPTAQPALQKASPSVTRPNADARPPGSLPPGALGRTPDRAHTPVRPGVFGRVTRAVSRRRARGLPASQVDGPSGQAGAATTGTALLRAAPGDIVHAGSAAVQMQAGSPQSLDDALSTWMCMDLEAVADALERVDVDPDDSDVLDALRHLDALLRGYRPHLSGRAAAHANEVAVWLAQAERAHAYTVIQRLCEPPRGFPAEANLLIDSSSLYERKRQVYGDVPRRSAIIATTRHCARECVAPAVAAVRARHVMASLIWRQYERIEIEAYAGEEAASPVRSCAQDIRGLVVALRHLFAPGDIPDSLESRQLFAALARSQALHETSLARAEADAWNERRDAPGIAPAVYHRLDAARTEEQRATREALRVVLGRPFRNYLGMIVAAL